MHSLIRTFHYNLNKGPLYLMIITLCYVHNQSRVLVGMDIYHVTQGAISNGRAENRNVILKVYTVISDHNRGNPS